MLLFYPVVPDAFGDRMVFEYDTARLCNLIETVAAYHAASGNYNSLERPVDLTVTQMQKLCYFCDFDHFEQYGESLTDCIYVRTPKGPAPIFFHRAVRELVTDERISLKGNAIVPSEDAIHELDVNSKEIPHSDKWSFDELLTIIHTVNRYSRYSEKELCQLSRKDNPCQIAGDYQALNYNAAYYRKPFYSNREDSDE